MKKYEISVDKKIQVSDLYIKRYENSMDNNLKNDIQMLIDCFNQEYEWNAMFNIDDVNQRLKNNQIVFILYYKKTPIGYVFFKIINSDVCFGYNLYVVKKIKKPKYSAHWFYNIVTNNMLSQYKKIQVEVEDWNWVIIDIIKNIGYYERDTDY